jgi:hypothetical protein
MHLKGDFVSCGRGGLGIWDDAGRASRQMEKAKLMKKVVEKSAPF